MSLKTPLFLRRLAAGGVDHPLLAILLGDGGQRALDGVKQSGVALLDGYGNGGVGLKAAALGKLDVCQIRIAGDNAGCNRQLGCERIDLAALKRDNHQRISGQRRDMVDTLNLIDNSVVKRVELTLHLAAG